MSTRTIKRSPDKRKHGSRWISRLQRIRLYLRDANEEGYPVCWQCGLALLPGQVEIDHLMPGDGPSTDRMFHLLTVSCAECNGRRHNLPLSLTLRWLQKRQGRARMLEALHTLARRHKPLPTPFQAKMWWSCYSTLPRFPEASFEYAPLFASSLSETFGLLR